MIHYQDKIINAAFFMRLALSKVAIGAKTIWEIIMSCFGSGVWKNNSPWRNNETWKNN